MTGSRLSTAVRLALLPHRTQGRDLGQIPRARGGHVGSVCIARRAKIPLKNVHDASQISDFLRKSGVRFKKSVVSEKKVPVTLMIYRIVMRQLLTEPPLSFTLQFCHPRSEIGDRRSL